MAQYKKYSKIEKKYYRKQLETLYKIFTQQGFKHIEFINMIGTYSDKNEGVDLQILCERDGCIQMIPISLRSRNNCGYRDITLRKYASFSHGDSEYAKLKADKYLASAIFYSWHTDRNPNYINYALVSTKELRRVVDKFNEDKYIIKNYRTLPNGEIQYDGSEAIVIPVKELHLLASYIN